MKKIFVEIYQMMLHNTYHGSRVYGIRREVFSCFPYQALKFVKHVTPGLAHFWPQEHNLNKLGRGPLDDASYQISRL